MARGSAAAGRAGICPDCARATAPAGNPAPPSPGVEPAADPGGRPALRLRHGTDEVLVSTCGAQVLSWRHRDADVLWTATRAEHRPGRPVRGGIPVVFPWFGDHPSDPDLPAHGFARNQPWQLAAAGPGPAVVLEMSDDAATRASWPHPFRLRCAVALGDTLRIALAVENRGPSAFACEQALHTYFAVGDVRTASVHGLEGLVPSEHAREPDAGVDVRQPIRCRAETDRIYQGVGDRIELRAPALSRTVVLRAGNARSAIVWNPWADRCARMPQLAPDDWQRFLCIETANVREHRVELAPGQRHELALELEAR